MNPFISTRKLTDCKEDHLTEFFAALLEIDTAFRDAYTNLILVPHARKMGWSAPEIVSIETQTGYEEFRSRPDMVLTLGDGHVIACEHKLDAPQTQLSLGEDVSKPVPQLDRYLMSPLDGLAFVRSSMSPPTASVLDHPKYICPEGRQHFLWRDFFPLLEIGDSPVAKWLKEGFEKLGFTPPNEYIGDLTESGDRENFAKLWSTTKALAHQNGWSVNVGGVIELYLTPKSSSSGVNLVWISPANQLLRIRLRCNDLPSQNRILPALEAFGAPWSLEQSVLRQTTGNALVLQMSAPLRALLAGAGTADQIEGELAKQVLAVLEAASARING